MEPATVRELSNQLPHAFWMRFAAGPDGKPVPPFATLRAAYPAATYQAIFDEAEAILKLPRHLSMHPGGVVVAPTRLQTWCLLCARVAKERSLPSSIWIQ